MRLPIAQACFHLAEIISRPAPPPDRFIDSLPEAFGAVINGRVEVIGYKGEWYTILKPSMRVLLHNLLIEFGNQQRRARL